MDVELTAQLQLAKQGDVQAFSYVATAFRTRLLAWATECTANSHTAEDAAQEALMIAFTQLASLREVEAFPGWLRTLTRTAAFRQQRRKRPDTMAEPEAGEDEPDAVVAAELKAAVHGAVQELSQAQQQVIERHYLRGEKIEEIAVALGLPTGTVKRRLHDAREKLRSRLSGFGPASDDQWRG
ncbi:MAG: RNA polymerase sigma factor [Planctomycetes bacterium]|nr:RNA polymerase sigma factor [Planctomycetota bacterium]